MIRCWWQEICSYNLKFYTLKKLEIIFAFSALMLSTLLVLYIEQQRTDTFFTSCTSKLDHGSYNILLTSPLPANFSGNKEDALNYAGQARVTGRKASSFNSIRKILAYSAPRERSIECDFITATLVSIEVFCLKNSPCKTNNVFVLREIII